MALDMPNALMIGTGFRTHSSKTPEDVFKGVILDHVSMRKDLKILRQCEMRESKEARVPS